MTNMGGGVKDLISALERVVDMEDLLQRVWLDIGPYNSGKVSPETLRRLNNFQEFDDSE